MNLIVIILILSLNYWRVINLFLINIKKKDLSFYWNKVYEPKYLSFDKKISRILSEKKINFKIFKGNTLNENDEIKKSDGTPFKVFTPFWRAAEKFYLEKKISLKILK